MVNVGQVLYLARVEQTKSPKRSDIWGWQALQAVQAVQVPVKSLSDGDEFSESSFRCAATGL